MEFQLAGASVIGRDHVAAFKNNQDAYGFRTDGHLTLAVVADGCGSAKHSEVGAQLAVKILLESFNLAGAIRPKQEAFKVLEMLLSKLQHDLGSIATTLAGLSLSDHTRNEAIADYLLFSLVGVVCDEQAIVPFCIGDGVIILDSKVIELTAPGNAPQYLGYSLMHNGRGDSLEVSTARVLTGSYVPEYFVVGTDGVMDLVRASDEKSYPGRFTRVEPLDSLWLNDAHFTNPAALQRRLVRMATPKTQLADDGGQQWVKTDPGLLSDDTTLIVGRRVPEVEEVTDDSASDS